MSTDLQYSLDAIPYGLTPELRHSRWRRTRACNDSEVTESKRENARHSGCCLQRLARPLIGQGASQTILYWVVLHIQISARSHGVAAPSEDRIFPMRIPCQD
jgi:hypothetical protein